MSEWMICPSCNLHHSVRPTRVCPRCNLSVDGAAASSASEPEGATAQPPADDAPAPFPGTPARPADARRTVVETSSCVNHPGVTTALVSCQRCGRRFCSDCVIALRGAFFCLDCKGEQVRDIQSGTVDRKLRVMECIGMGWDLIKQDLWPIWTVGLVFLAVGFGVGLLGVIPIIGPLFQLAATFLVNPPLQAGLAYAMLRTIDGRPAEAGDLFEAFRSRYWQSILVMLPVIGLYLVVMIVMVAGVFGLVFVGQAMSHEVPPVLKIVGIALGVLAVLIFIAIAMFVTSAVWFAYIEMWEGPATGWSALMTGLRVAKDNLAPTLGMAGMLGLLGFAAALAGMLALCVGLIFTIPFITAWGTITHVYAYRSWSRAGAARDR
jgi:hypothetical protein